jgi:hypothetical protein
VIAVRIDPPGLFHLNSYLLLTDTFDHSSARTFKAFRNGMMAFSHAKPIEMVTTNAQNSPGRGAPPPDMLPAGQVDLPSTVSRHKLLHILKVSKF